MGANQLLTRVRDSIDGLPGDLFSIKSSFLLPLPALAEHDLESCVVKLGKAGERLAKGCLAQHDVPFNETDSFDWLIRSLASVTPSPTVIVGLRTVLKYRNQAAHDSRSALSAHDLDAAVASFCAAYQAAWQNYFRAQADPQAGAQPAAAPAPAAQAGRIAFQREIGLVCLAAALTLLWAAARGGSYDFFILLRIEVTASATAAGWALFRRGGPAWPAFLGLGLLFNPVLPIYLNRSLWMPIDLAAALIFIVGGVHLLRSGRIRPKADAGGGG